MTNEEFLRSIHEIKSLYFANQLQVKDGEGKWVDANPAVVFEIIRREYRIKPQPREVFLHAKDLPISTRTVVTGTTIVGTEFFDPQSRNELVRFREVLE